MPQQTGKGPIELGAPVDFGEVPNLFLIGMQRRQTNFVDHLAVLRVSEHWHMT